METFDLHRNLLGIDTDWVSRQEFAEYYKNVSSVIDNDPYFELLLHNVWKLQPFA